MEKQKQLTVIYLLLATVTLIAFWHVGNADFITFDDPEYVTENIHVQNGITWETIRWAFTTMDVAYWHPLTWMSHMLDVQLFGLNPRWHHLTNLLFHIANTLLLFFVFNRMTKATWKSAFVAALFALHPLRVESVAWVAERKDVLSTFFWMLTMAAYVYYVERPRLKSYLAVLAFFVLGLMAKPILVTLPFALLLLDYWPLRRFYQEKSALEIRTGVEKPLSINKKSGNSRKKQVPQGRAKSEEPDSPKFQWQLIRPLLREKTFLFALAGLSCIATYIAQANAGAVASAEALSPGLRIANAFVSYVIYIEKMIWPTNLAVFYPHPGTWPIWQLLGAILLLVAITLMIIRRSEKSPYLALGWLWYLGTFVPVIGIVQAGRQAMADRFTYIPLIGLSVIAAWGVPELLGKWRHKKEVLVASSVLILACLITVTWVQAGYWQNNLTLYNQTLRVTSRNAVIRNNRGLAYVKAGNFKQAMEDYDEAIEIDPGLTLAYFNRGLASWCQGNLKDAIPDFDRAIRIGPVYPKFYSSRGVVHDDLGDHRQAIEDFDKAIGIDPKDALAYNCRGAAYGKLGDNMRAIEDFDRAIGLKPKYADAYFNRGVAYTAVGNFTQAISDFDKTVKINPDYARAYNKRGSAQGALGNYKQAILDFNRVIEIDPRNAEAYFKRGVANGKLGNRKEAVEDLKTAAVLDDENAKNALRSLGISW